MPGWIAYVSPTVAVIALGVSFVAYRRVSKMKALDLRLELGKLIVDTEQDLAGIESLMDSAYQSRVTVYGVMGIGSSGAMETWKNQLQADHSVFAGFKTEFSGDRSDHRKLSHLELESKLLRVHALHRKIQRLSDKYRAALVNDDKQREQLRAVATRINQRT
jgi:hypothetical protein